MSELEDLRKSIDEIDANIAILLDKRFSLCHEVAQYKKENNVPTLDENREKVVITNVSKIVEIPKAKYVKSIYTAIMDESKKYEDEINNK